MDLCKQYNAQHSLTIVISSILSILWEIRAFRFSNRFLIYSGLSGICVVSIETSSQLFSVSSEAPGFMRPHS